MKNPIKNWIHARRVWRNLNRFEGVFSRADARMQLNRVLLPARFHTRQAARMLPMETHLEEQSDGAWRVDLPGHDLSFFWPRRPDQNLHFVIEQEFSRDNPHCYTTPPIALRSDSVILDVGACEGLFAFRALTQHLAERVVAFEPLPRMAELLRRGAELNGLAKQLDVERFAVGAESGWAELIEGSTPDDAVFEPLPPGEPRDADAVGVVALDDWCAEKGLELRPVDLIKIDAEGSDLAVLHGAESCIQNHAPQIAVTTYHHDEHARRMIEWLREVQPEYKLRLKGFSFWTPVPRPVLLQASVA